MIVTRDGETYYEHQAPTREEKLRRQRACMRRLRSIRRALAFCRENFGPDCRYRSTLDPEIVLRVAVQGNRAYF